MALSYRSGNRRTVIHTPLPGAAIWEQALPAEAVTFLYTDIEGSTRRWESTPRAMREALGRHHAILREAIGAQRGVIYQIVGDAFVAIFADAPDGLRAALQAQRALHAEPWPAPVAPLRVRMALHHGRGYSLDDGFHAEALLSRLSRLLGACHGGQVVLTAEVYDRIGARWPPEVAARDLGLHQLRDLAARLHVWQAVAPGLPADFPPLRSADHDCSA